VIIQTLCKQRASSRIAAACLTILLVGCGYKGPLYLPPPPNTLGTPQKTNASTAPEPNIPPMQENPSLEPAPIVIE